MTIVCDKNIDKRYALLYMSKKTLKNCSDIGTEFIIS
jgi:hypothetical protein